MSHEAYFDALSRYKGYRDAAYAATWNELHEEMPRFSDLKIMPITELSISYWNAIRQFGLQNKVGDFEWEEIFNQISNWPKRFDVAIWDGKYLAGMSSGKVSSANRFVNINFIERFKSDINNFQGQIAKIAVTVADNYAFILGAEAVRLKNPASSLLPFYGRLGFHTQYKEQGNLFLERKVVYDEM